MSGSLSKLQCKEGVGERAGHHRVGRGGREGQPWPSGSTSHALGTAWAPVHACAEQWRIFIMHDQFAVGTNKLNSPLVVPGEQGRNQHAAEPHRPGVHAQLLAHPQH